MTRKNSGFFAVSIFVILILNLYGQETRQFPANRIKGTVKAITLDSLLVSSARLAESHPDSALTLANAAYGMAINTNDNKSLAAAAKTIADAWYYKNEYVNAITYYNESADAALLAGNVNDSGSYYADRISDVAFCYMQLGIYEKAINLEGIALRINRRLDRLSETGSSLNNIGNNYFYLGQYDKAIQYLTKAHELDLQSGDSSDISVSLNNIGMVYSRWGRHRQALSFYEDALNYTTSEIRKAIRLSNIGMEWFHLGDYKKALEYLNQALESDIKNNQTVKIGIRKNEISTVLSAMGEYEKAIRLNEEALLIFRKAGIRESQIITLADMGDIYLGMGQYTKAELCFLEGLELARTTKSLHNQARIFKSLYELSERKGDFKKALDYFKNYSAVNDSVFSEIKHRQLANFEILYETGQKEKENQLLLRDNELKEKRQRLSIAIIVALAIILILIFFLYRMKSASLSQSRKLLAQEQELARLEIEKKTAENKLLEDRVFAEQQINRLEREKHQSEIEYKNAELAGTTLSLVNKNEILGEIRTMLMSNHKPETIPGAIRFINANTDIDQDWNKFRLTFEEVHPGFFDRLQRQYPQLTDHDVRLSAYLRINLSSREIAGLMNVSLDATNKGRQRLRKKLDLAPESDLNEFLKSV